MRDLAIAYGNNRQAKKWVNKTTKYEDLKERLKVTIRTTESAEEYAKMNRAQRDAAKDHGCFVGGVLAGGRRKVDIVESRSMIALDGNRIDTDFLDNYETNAPYTSFLYTTHSHTPNNPRVRLIFPLTRDITAEEFVAVSRYLAQMLQTTLLPSKTTTSWHKEVRHDTCRIFDTCCLLRRCDGLLHREHNHAD